MRFDQVHLVKMSDAEFQQFEAGMTEVRRLRAEVRAEVARELREDLATSGVSARYRAMADTTPQERLTRELVLAGLSDAQVRRHLRGLYEG